MIVYGTRLYGSIDETPVGFVATRFAHIWFVPLVPLASFFVTRDEGRSFSGVPLPMNGRSVFAGYARAFGWLSMIGGGLLFLHQLVFRFGGELEIFLRGGTAVTLEDLLSTVITVAGLFLLLVLGVVALLVTRSMRKPSEERRAELSRMMGVEIPQV